MKKLMQLLRENAAQARQPLNLVRADGSSEATLYIYDVIDSYWGISAKEVAQAIAGLGADTTLHLRINSPGGDVFEATAIASTIKQHPGKTIAHIDGLAASAATFISAAADEVEIADGGFYMIHNGWTIALGDKRVMQDTAALLEKVDGSILAAYAARTGQGAEQLQQWMDAETWFTAQEAVDNKFADRLISAASKPGNTTDRHFNLAAYDKTPQALLTPKTPEPATPDFAALRAANQRRLRLLSID